MSRSAQAALALALLLCPAPAFGQSGADVIPDDAAFGLAVRSLSGLDAKFEKLAKAHRLQQFRATWVPAFLGIKMGLDWKGPAAIAYPNLVRLKWDGKEDPWQGFYAIFPVKNAGEIAGNFKLKEADFKGGKIQPLPPTWLRDKQFGMLKGKQFFVGMHPKPLAVATPYRPLTGQLGAVGATHRASLAKSDLVLFFGAENQGAEYGQGLDNLENGLKGAGEAGEAKALADALRGLRFVTGGLSVDEGARADIFAVFHSGKKGDAARKFLKRLAAGPGASDLVGLPNGRPLALFAAKGDGTSNVAMARTLVRFLLLGHFRWLLPGKERGAFITALEKLYRELKGSRAALYANEDARKGRFALVGILDIGDTEKLLAEVPGMSGRLSKALDNAFGGKKAVEAIFQPKAEKIDGLDVHLLRLKATGLPEKDRKAALVALGPDWGKVRLVVVGKKVALLAGSNVALLKEAIANLKKGTRGLADDKVVAGELARLSKERKLEMHLNMEGLALVNAGKKPGPLRGLMSFALTVEPERLRVEAVVSTSEIRPLAACFWWINPE